MAITHSSGSKKTTFAGVAIAILIGLYGLLRPSINEATGWSLPAIAQTQSETVTKPTEPSSEKPSAVKPAEQSNEAQSRPTTPPASPPAADETVPDDTLKYGLLREIGRDRYVSPAGLLYTPGSAEGHRLEHLRRHIEDQPSRSGKHGVFDGGMEGALKTIDQAYEKAKIGKRTTTRKEDGRTIYTVDLGHRIGFVGGREGNQKNQPMARRVQLVLDGNRVITAFPL